MSYFRKATVCLVAAASCVLVSCSTTPTQVASDDARLNFSTEIVGELLLKEMPAVGAQQAKDCQMLMALALAAAGSGNYGFEKGSQKLKIGGQVMQQAWADVLTREAAAEGIDATTLRSTVANDLAAVIVDKSDDVAQSLLKDKSEVCTNTVTSALSRVQKSLMSMKRSGDLKSLTKT